MNGFSSSILTMLLSWIRSLITRFWMLLGSEQGGSLIALFRAYWKTIFIIFCAGGFVVDRLIYLIRWRPYYVWGTKLDRLKRWLRGERRHDEPAAGQEQTDPTAALPNADSHTSRYVYTQQLASANEDQHTQRAGYAYTAQAAALPEKPVYSQNSVAWTPPQEDSMGFSHPSPFAPEPLLPLETLAEPFENPGENLFSTFGTSKPEPVQYLRDTASGFASSVDPWTLFPPSPSNANEPLHPGLDAETFQQNIGLSPSAGLFGSGDEDPLKPRLVAGTSKRNPYYQNEAKKDTKRRSVFSRFAKKARSLVTISDENNPPSIRDLQSPVDIKSAYNAPVFPDANGEGGERR